MKRVLCSVAILAASVCAADEIVSSNVLGIMPVTSNAKRTIVSVPWCAMSASDDAAIQVSNLVKTANLSVGDLLHYVNSDGSYNTWRLAAGDNDVKYWASVNEAGEGSLGSSPASDVTTVARGNAIVLIRNGADLSKPFYLYGQVGAAATVSSTIPAGTPSTPAYTLVASPKPGAWKVNSAAWENVGAGDSIYAPGGTGYDVQLFWQASDSRWGVSNDVWAVVGGERVRTGREFAVYEEDIPAGQGVWYVSKGGNPTISWSEVPVR